jgi:hypothetical protein
MRKTFLIVLLGYIPSTFLLWWGVSFDQTYYKCAGGLGGGFEGLKNARDSIILMGFVWFWVTNKILFLLVNDSRSTIKVILLFGLLLPSVIAYLLVAFLGVRFAIAIFYFMIPPIWYSVRIYLDRIGLKSFND